jgi:photosystem II stability/assembly factor-like uncharacterized protein
MKSKSVVMAAILAVFFLSGVSGLSSESQTRGKEAAPALSPDLLKSVHFRSIGPTQQGGRFVDFAVPLQQPHTFYAATGSGGLWKTTNNGQTFETLFDHESVFSIGDVAVAPSDPRIVWVGSGEANNSRSTYWGDGVYKSTDEGKTWTNMGLKESHHVGRIVIHPTNPDIVYVAALGHLYSHNPERGLYKTTDGGKTWAKSLDVVAKDRAIGCVDVVMDPSNPDVLYAATYDRHRRPWTYDIGGPGSGVYKTTDSGKTWARMTNGLPGGLLGRIGLAVYPKNPKILYACVENVNKPGMSEEERWKEIQDGKSSRGMIDGEIYRSDDAGMTWRKVSPEKRSVGGSPGYYYGQIIVDPNDDQVVYILSVGVLASRDGGKTWNAPFRFGGDNHALWIDPADSQHMLLGYDHGMGVTWDGGQNWYHPDFLSIAQFYAVDYDMSYPYRVAGGLQDNGSVLGPSTKPGTSGGGRFGMTGAPSGIPGGPPIRLEDWYGVGGGDGMYNVFDRTTNRFLYNESQFGPLSRLDLETGERTSIAYRKPGSRWNWCAPILVSAHDSDTIYHCGNLVVMSTNRGETWTEISPDLTTNDPAKLPVNGQGGDGNIQYCTITTFDESPLVAGLLWAGTDDGNVWVTRTNGAAWTQLNDKIAGNPGYWVSRVAASNFDPATAYVTYTGYRRDDFKPFVYKTTDYGETWTSIAGDLKVGPVNVIREDPANPGLLYLGTEFGVYVSIDGGAHWVKMSGEMPTQPVQDLKIHPRDRDLIVATHGRGIYIADVAPLQELRAETLARDVHLFSVEPGVLWTGGLSPESSSSNFSGESAPRGIIVHYYLKTKPKADVKFQVFKGNMLINELTGSSDPGLNRAYWDMTIRRERTAEEKAAIQEQMKKMAEAGYRMRMDVNYVTAPAGEGEYKIVLTVDGKTFAQSVSVLRDPRF